MTLRASNRAGPPEPSPPPPAERRSTGAPVESMVARPSKMPRALPVLAVAGGLVACGDAGSVGASQVMLEGLPA